MIRLHSKTRETDRWRERLLKLEEKLVFLLRNSLMINVLKQKIRN